MTSSDTINSVIQLPRKFASFGNVSFYALLERTGYFENHDQISEDAIREALLHHPECVDEWMLWSANKRSSTGWYFKQNDEKRGYVVGYYSGKADDNRRTEYADQMDACAAFIKLEMENIRRG